MKNRSIALTSLFRNTHRTAENIVSGGFSILIGVHLGTDLLHGVGMSIQIDGFSKIDAYGNGFAVDSRDWVVLLL